MPFALQAMLSVLGRIMLCTIFLMSAVGNKIPHFDKVADVMAGAGVPQPKVMLAGAIVFLIVGSISVILGWYARLGALLLLIFLVLATAYFHAFWNESNPAAVENQMIQFMKNLGLAGAMVFICANGPGAMSVDATRASRG